jgi:hypothetical protein
MIYIYSGNDIKKKNSYLKKLYKNDEAILLPEQETTKELIFNYRDSVTLFGGNQIIILENLLKSESVTFSQEDILSLRDSKTIFIFLEEKLLAPILKKYKQYAIIENFNINEVKQIPKINIFNIVDSFSRKDKINTWILYREAISFGIQPEEISGVIFWKIKTMLLSGTKFFSADELKRKSSELVSIYHKAHRGDCDFIISLEQFILSSLSK